MSDQSRPIDALISDLNVPSTEPEPRTNGANGKPKDYNQLVTAALESLSPPVNKDEIERIIRTTLYENGFTNYRQGDIQTHRRNNNELIADLLEKSKETPKPPPKSDPPTDPAKDNDKPPAKSKFSETVERVKCETHNKSERNAKTAREIKDEAKREIEREAAELRQNKSGIALYSAYLTFDAINALGLSAKQRLYVLLAGNINLKTGVTHQRSRKDLAEQLSIKKRQWYHIERELRTAGLINYHENDHKRWDIPCSFILPHVHDWYNNVERKLK